ncbi:MAG: hypothetical protein J0G34_10530 [Afipia sp.]|nr:hypothetical protein [Afipia sp.]
MIRPSAKRKQKPPEQALGGPFSGLPMSSWCKFILNEGANLRPPLTIGISLWSLLEEIERITCACHFHGRGGIGGNRRSARDPFCHLHMVGHAKQARGLSAMRIANDAIAMGVHMQSHPSMRRLR